jgi:hypothetical protein
VKPGGDAVHGRFRELAGTRGDEQVAPSAAAGAHPAHVAVELAAREEVRERVLVDPRRAAVGQVFSSATAASRCGGTTSQPSRSAGASALLTEPA